MRERGTDGRHSGKLVEPASVGERQRLIDRRIREACIEALEPRVLLTGAIAELPVAAMFTHGLQAAHLRPVAPPAGARVAPVQLPGRSRPSGHHHHHVRSKPASTPAAAPAVSASQSWGATTTFIGSSPSGGAHPTAPSTPTAPGATGQSFVTPAAATITNVLVNNPALDTTSNDTQSETSTIAFGSTVLTAYNDSGSNAINSTKFTGWSRSTDGGATFTDMGALPTNTNGDAGDPVLARDNVSGAVYLATLSKGAANVIQIFKSTDGGVTFATPVNACPGFTGGRLDKEWLAVDNSSGAGQGNVYLVVRDFGTNNGIRVTRSTDGGATWSPSNGTAIATGTSVQGAWVTIGADHAVYAFWYDGTGTQHLFMRKSTDLGLTFGSTVTVSTLATTGTNGDFGLGFRTSAFPQAVANPANPNLVYVTYADKGASPDRCNIYFTQSINGGTTWSTPVKVNDDVTTRDQWQPSLAIMPNGSQLFIGWYDRRNDSANSLIDTYGVVASIAGNTVSFQPNFKITTTSFSSVYGVDPAINTVYMGDYDSASADNSSFYYCWADNRDNSLFRTGKQANIRFAKISTNMQVSTTAPAGGAIISTAPSDFVIVFTDPYDPASVQAGDLTVNGIAANSVAQTDARTLTFHYNTSPVIAQGSQTMAMAAAAVTRLSDQNPLDAFSGSFRYDLVPMTVTSTTPANGSVAALPLSALDVHFSEPYAAASIATSNLTISQGTVSAFTLLDSQTVRYTLSGINTEVTVNFSLAAGAVNDAFGNPGQAYSGSFSTDIGTVPFPTPLASATPQGSMIFTGSAAAAIGPAGDTDRFVIDLDAGQTLTVSAVGATTLQPTLQVLGPANNLLGTAAATGVGQPALLQTLPVTVAGTYTIVVAGAGSTTGTYTVALTLNAAQQASALGGPTNHTLASAQDLSASFISLGGAGSRGAVLGTPQSAGGSAATVLSTDFETGLGGFTISNTLGSMWHLSTGRTTQAGHSATHSIYFGQAEGASGGGNYNTGARVAGTVTSPSIALPAGSNDTLDFNYVLQTEGGSTFDQALVQISTNGGSTFTTLTNLSVSGQSTVWKPVTSISLATYAGQTVQLRFSFDTVDGIANTFEGWYIDDISVQSISPVQDYYAFNLAAGDSTTLALKAVTVGSDLTFLDSNNNVLSASTSGATNVDKMIADFIAPSTGTYYAQVSSRAGNNYSLTLTRNADFDTETNDTTAAAQVIQLGKVQRILGNIGGTATSPLSLDPFLGRSIDGLSAEGVQFSFAVNDASSTDAVVQSSTDASPLGDSVIRGDATGTITLNFDNPTASLYFDLGFAPGEAGGQPGGGNGEDDSSPTGFVQLFDAEGNLVENFSLGTDPQAHSAFTAGHFRYDGPTPIARAVIQMGQPDGDFALGNLAVTSGNTVDTYKITLAAGAVLSAQTFTSADGPGEYVNTFNPRLRVLNSAGTQVAIDDNSAPDGRNASIKYVAPSAGTYYVEVSSTTAATTFGDYILGFGDALTLSFPSDVHEGDETLIGTVGVTIAPISDLTIALSCTDAWRLDIPATVTIPAGRTSVQVPLTVVDNTLLDGFEAVSISASASGYPTVAGTINVHDNETAALTVSLQTSAKEGDGTLAGTITSSAAPTRDIVVQLSSNTSSRLTVPATVTLKAGQTTASFNATVVDNTVIDGTQTATVTAAVENWTSGTASVAVQDNDATLAVTLPAGGWEGQTLTGGGTVRIGGTRATSLVVSLSSDNPSLTVPSTVTIPAGQTTATFDLIFLSDGLQNGSRTANVTASAAGLPVGTSSLVIHDSNLDHLTFDPIVGSKIAGTAFTVTARAWNIANEVIAIYNGAGALTAVGQAGNLPVSPTSGSFVAGVWTASVTLTIVDPAVVLTASTGGQSVSSSAFLVRVGLLSGFAWGAVSTPQIANQPFSETVTAKDANGNTVTGFSGSATLSGLAGSVTSQNMLGSPAFTNSNASGTLTVGYAFTPSTNIQVTAVRSYFGTKVSFWTNAGTLLASQAVSGSATAWTETSLATPITLLEGTTYRITVYTAGATYYWRSIAPTSPPFATLGQTYEINGDFFPTTADTGHYWLVDLRGNAGTFTPVPITPTTTVTFVKGVWTGDVSVTQSATGMHLHANDGASHPGDSATFDVINPATAPSAPVLAASTDSGTSAVDGVTTFNNSTSVRAPQFTVAGTINGATVTIYADGAAIGSAVATGTSTTVTADGVTVLADGVRSITARQTYPGHPQTVDSPAQSITILTTTPQTPSAPDLQAASDSGVSSTDNITNVSAPTFDLTGVSPYYRFYRNGILISGSYASGSAYTTSTQSDGTYNYTVAAVDAAGNVSSPSAALAVTVDTVAWAPSPEGQFDTTFGVGGAAGNSSALRIVFHTVRTAIAPDGKIVMAGASFNGVDDDFCVCRFNADGTPDTTFGTGGVVSTNLLGEDIADAVAIQPDGKIVVGGLAGAGNRTSGTANIAWVRYNVDGTLDNTFGTSGKPYTRATEMRFLQGAMLVLPNGTIVTSGAGYDGTTLSFETTRLNANGTRDTSFGSNGVTFTAFAPNSQAYAIARQSDGKIIVGGTNFNLARYNANGSLDTSFGTQGTITSLGGTLYGLAVQPDGKTLAVGSVPSPGGFTMRQLVRFLPNGSLDTTFGINGIVQGPAITGSESATSVALQPDGKIIMGGNISAATIHGFVTRYTSSGVVDPTFGVNGTAVPGLPSGNGLDSLAILPSGQIVAVGGSVNAPYTNPEILYRFNAGSAGAPSIALDSASDHGVSSSDHITNAAAPLFNVTHPDPYFRVYRNGSLISAAYQQGSTYAVSIQTDGNYNYTVTSVDAAGNESAAGAAQPVTIDTIAPSSSVSAVTPVSNTQTFTVSWSGTDNPGGSGISSYDVYVSDNGGAFTPWLAGTTLISSTYTGQAGHSYGFYSIARDVAGNVQSTPGAAQTSTTLTATSVVGRFVFYNHSYWNDPSAGRTDDLAIDTSKSALLPGQTASFANYTGYLRGMNGVMIDVANLAGTPAASDFIFKTGNDSSPANWATAPAPASIIVRRGAGAGGSDRIELIWGDNVIQNQWLQITLKATDSTGLAVPDVFYFGNAIGETGNNSTGPTPDTFVDAGDMIAVRDNVTAFGVHELPSSRFDLNHDGFADASDMIVVRDHVGDPLNRLQFITPPLPQAPAGGGAAAPATTPVLTPPSPAAASPSTTAFSATGVSAPTPRVALNAKVPTGARSPAVKAPAATKPITTSAVPPIATLPIPRAAGRHGHLPKGGVASPSAQPFSAVPISQPFPSPPLSSPSQAPDGQDTLLGVRMGTVLGKRHYRLRSTAPTSS